MNRELLQQAHDALLALISEIADTHPMAGFDEYDSGAFKRACAVERALRAALAAPQGEPAFYFADDGGAMLAIFRTRSEWEDFCADCGPLDSGALYAGPQPAAPSVPQGEPAWYKFVDGKMTGIRTRSRSIADDWIARGEDIRLIAAPPAAPSVPEVTDEMVEAAENYLRSILNGASLPRRYMRGILHAALSEKSAAPSGLAEPPK